MPASVGGLSFIVRDFNTGYKVHLYSFQNQSNDCIELKKGIKIIYTKNSLVKTTGIFVVSYLTFYEMYHVTQGWCIYMWLEILLQFRSFKINVKDRIQLLLKNYQKYSTIKRVVEFQSDFYFHIC